MKLNFSQLPGEDTPDFANYCIATMHLFFAFPQAMCGCLVSCSKGKYNYVHFCRLSIIKMWRRKRQNLLIIS